MAHGSKFTLPLWLNIGIIICLVHVQHVLAKQKFTGVRHRFEKNTSLALAWSTDEIEEGLANMGFNFTHCKERHWKKYVPEAKREDAKFRRRIRRLCKRYLLPNDADRMEARRRYLAHVAKKHKFVEMVQLVLSKLSEYNETLEQMLNDKKFVINKDNSDCYWNVYYSFSEICADPKFDFRVLDIRNIFANACKAPWLNRDKIRQYFSEACSTFDIYEF